MIQYLKLTLKFNKMKIDIDTLREDLFTDFIQEYNHLTNDQVSELVDIELNKIIKNEKSNNHSTI